jgi:hypothetical protein
MRRHRGHTILYTLDGRDPQPRRRALAAASTYWGPSRSTRTPSPAARPTPSTGPERQTDFTFVVTTPPLVITELMYHPLETVPNSLYSADD